MASTNINELIKTEPADTKFVPYCELSEDADALTVYFKPDAEYSKRLTDHITLYLTLDGKDEIVGCRIKGIRGILDDLPNYLNINHDGVELSFIFWSFRGGAKDEHQRLAINKLAEAAGDLTVPIA